MAGTKTKRKKPTGVRKPAPRKPRAATTRKRKPAGTPKKTTATRAKRARTVTKTTKPTKPRARKRPIRRATKPEPLNPVAIERFVSEITGHTPAKAAAPVVPAAKAAAVAKAKAQLPEAYGTGKVHLVARDPRWLYAHWDFTREQQRELNELSPSGHLSVRIHKDSPDGTVVQQVKLSPTSRHWFFPVGYGEKDYVADLGYEDNSRHWVSVAISNIATTPADTLAADRSVVFATIPMHTTFAEIRQVLDTSGTGNETMVQAIRRYAAASQAEGATEPSPTAPEAPWTLEKARRLAHVMGVESMHRRMRDDLSSLALTGIVPPEAATWPQLHLDWDYEPFGSSESTKPAWSGELGEAA